MTPHITAKEAIRNRLETATTSLAVHEFKLLGYSENAIATRLSEMAHAGEVIGTYRKGEAFKEWRLIHVQPIQIRYEGNQQVMGL